MLKQYLEIGQIVGTHGIKGEVRLNPWCDSPEFVKRFKTLYFDSEGRNGVKIISCRPHGNVVILKLENTDTVESASALRNKILFMNRDDSGLGDGDWFVQDLIGCTVADYNDENIVYGTLTDVTAGAGANDIWSVTDSDNREYLLPAIKDVVKDVDVKNGIIKISPMRGIFDNAD